jgi:DNA polymerase-3 subunit delta'
MAFDDIIGHERQKRFLSYLMERGNIPHAFLFCGQEGIGKRKVATEIARRLFCQVRTGCGECRPCIKLDRGNHPDFVVIQNEGSIGIEDSRMIAKEISEYPFEQDRRVIIIDNAETMTTEAANALLKTLEEPPPYNHFFIITSSEGEIPLTIRSRCTRVAFSPLSRDQLELYFSGRPDIDPDKARLLACISFGSIGSGLFWLDEGNFSLRVKMAEALSGRSKGFVLASSLAEKASSTDRSLSMYLAFLLSFFRDLFVKKTMGHTSPFITNTDLEDILDDTGGDLAWIEESLKRIQETVRVMRYNVNRWLLMEDLLIHVARE